MASWTRLSVLLEEQLQGVSDFLHAALIRVYSAVAPSLFSSSSFLLPPPSAAAAVPSSEIHIPLALPETAAFTERLVQGAVPESEAQSSAHPPVVQQALSGESLASQEGVDDEEMGGEERSVALIEGEREDVGVIDCEGGVSTREWEGGSSYREVGCQAEIDCREGGMQVDVSCQTEEAVASVDMGPQSEEEFCLMEASEVAAATSVDQTERPAESAEGGSYETLQAGRDEGSAQKDGGPLNNLKKQLSLANMLLTEVLERLEKTGTGADRVLVAQVRSKQQSFQASLRLNEQPLPKEPELPVFSAPSTSGSDAPFISGSDAPFISDSDAPSVNGSDALSISGSDAPSISGSEAPPISLSYAPDSSLLYAPTGWFLDAPPSSITDAPSAAQFSDAPSAARFSVAPTGWVPDASISCFSDAPSSCFSDAFSGSSFSDALPSSVSGTPASSVSDALDSSPTGWFSDALLSSPADAPSCSSAIVELSHFESPPSPRSPLDFSAEIWEDLPAEEQPGHVALSEGSCEWEDVDDSFLKGSHSQQQAPVLQVKTDDLFHERRQAQNRDGANASAQGKFVSNGNARRRGASACNPRNDFHSKNQNGFAHFDQQRPQERFGLPTRGNSRSAHAKEDDTEKCAQTAFQAANKGCSPTRDAAPTSEPKAALRHAPCEEVSIEPASRFSENVFELLGAKAKK